MLPFSEENHEAVVGAWKINVIEAVNPRWDDLYDSIV